MNFSYNQMPGGYNNNPQWNNPGNYNPNCQHMEQPLADGQPNTCPDVTMPTNIVNKCFVEWAPRPCNYHTHVVNTVVKKYYLVPTYSTSTETVYVDECCGGAPRIY